MGDFPEDLRRLMAARGVGVRELARLVPCNPGYVSNLRWGKKRPSQQIAVRLDQELDAGGVLAAHVLCADRAESPVSASGEGDHGAIRHQEFLALAGALSVSLGVLGSYPETELPERVAQSAARHVNVDAETVDGLTHVVRGFRQAYRAADASSLVNPVGGTLNLLAGLVPASGRYQRQLVSLIGQAASLMGVMFMLDLGDFVTARRYLMIAVRAARQAGDAELAAITFGCLAFHAAYSGDPHGGVEFAEEGLTVAGRGIHPRSHGWVAAVASEMHATLGPGGEPACRQALDVAGGQLTKQMPSEPWEGIGEFNTGKLTAYRGGDLLRLGRYRQARAELGSALTALGPGLAKHRCTAHIDLAEACIRDGDLDEGTHHAMKALDIIDRTYHAESLRRVQGLYRLVKTSATPLAQELGSRVTQAKAAT